MDRIPPGNPGASDIPDTLVAGARMGATLAVRARLAFGLDHETIRREATREGMKAVKALCAKLGRGEHKIEQYVMVIQRTIEEELAANG